MPTTGTPFDTLINTVLRAHELLTPDTEKLRALGVDPTNVRALPFST